MSSFFISFTAAALIILFIIKLAGSRGFALDSDLAGVQKVHARAVPRIGGIGIFFAVVIGGIVAMLREPSIGKGIFLLLMCSAVAFLGGIVEDFTRRVSPSRRLILTMIAAVIGYFVLDAKIDRLTWISSEWSLNYIWIALPLTVFAVAGIANAINIIDGFNGLASVVTICILFSLG
jgi:UDP-N-acetylmuramyl pentapeptide phosphotransferase/UDP-N-acetylglucosamine-1-phosphate transferase